MKTLRAHWTAFWVEPEKVCYANEPFSSIQARLEDKKITRSEIKNITNEIIENAHVLHAHGDGSHPFNTSQEYLPYRIEALLDGYNPLPGYILEKMIPLIYVGIKSEKFSESIMWARILSSFMYQRNIPSPILVEHINWINENIPEDSYEYNPISKPQRLPSNYSFLLGVLHAPSISPEVLTILCSNPNKLIRADAPEAREAKELRDAEETG